MGDHQRAYDPRRTRAVASMPVAVMSALLLLPSPPCAYAGVSTTTADDDDDDHHDTLLTGLCVFIYLVVY